MACAAVMTVNDSNGQSAKMWWKMYGYWLMLRNITTQAMYINMWGCVLITAFSALLLMQQLYCFLRTRYIVQVNLSTACNVTLSRFGSQLQPMHQTGKFLVRNTPAGNHANYFCVRARAEQASSYVRKIGRVSGLHGAQLNVTINYNLLLIR